jgi:hypothetical protein
MPGLRSQVPPGQAINASPLIDHGELARQALDQLG